MADGGRFDPGSDTVASRTLPLGTQARVTNLRNGRSAVVSVRDRGPHRGGRILDVSPGVAARLGMPIHPHMLRHSTGFKLANDGQDTRAIQHYLGHRNIQHTVLYTHLAAERFNGFWDD